MLGDAIKSVHCPTYDIVDGSNECNDHMIQSVDVFINIKIKTRMSVIVEFNATIYKKH